MTCERQSSVTSKCIYICQNVCNNLWHKSC